MQGKGNMGIADMAALLGSVGFGLFLVFAMLRAGRHRGAEALCMSNLHQWADIFQGYVQRNEGKFLSGHAWYWIERLDEQHKDRAFWDRWLR